MMNNRLNEIIKNRILVLDGAMGTMIQQYGLTEDDFRGNRFHSIEGMMKGNNDVLCITRPDIIEDIHCKYLEAGLTSLPPTHSAASAYRRLTITWRLSAVRWHLREHG